MLVEERKKCYEARDAYFSCLDANGGRRQRRALRKLYEKHCPSSWVKHFDKKRAEDEKREATRGRGATRRPRRAPGRRRGAPRRAVARDPGSRPIASRSFRRLPILIRDARRCAVTIAATIAAIGHTRGATAHRRGTATPRDAEARWTSSAGRSVASRFRISKDAATTNEKASRAAGSARARGAAAAAQAHPRSAGHRSTRIRPREAGEASARCRPRRAAPRSASAAAAGPRLRRRRRARRR